MTTRTYVDWASGTVKPLSEATFDGKTFDEQRDHGRLRAQLGRVLAILQDLEPHTLKGMAWRTGDPEASVSARIRDLRKPKFGGYVINRRYVGDGLWEYQMEAKR